MWMASARKRVYRLDSGDDPTPLQFSRFCLSGRTERAFRFSACVPLALLISYDENLVKSRFSHLAVVVYTIMAALLPPTFAFISLVWFMAVPAVLIGCGAMTLAWVFDSQIYEHGWTEHRVNGWTLGSMAFVFLLASNARIGTLAPLLTIAFYCITYVTQYALIQSSQVNSPTQRTLSPYN